MKRPIYKTLKFLFRKSNQKNQQRLLNMLPSGVMRFDLTSYFRSINKHS